MDTALEKQGEQHSAADSFLTSSTFIINVLLILILTALASYLPNRNFTVDDGLIYSRYLRNFVEGHGLVYNIGERFNGLTSPLYIYICMLISLLDHDVIVSQSIAYSLFLSASGIMLAIIFYKNNQPLTGFISSLLLVTSKYSYMLFGMESSLFIFLACAVFFSILKKTTTFFQYFQDCFC